MHSYHIIKIKKKPVPERDSANAAGEGRVPGGVNSK